MSLNYIVKIFSLILSRCNTYVQLFSCNQGYHWS
uniref:Uncharacterized protein n=1 Tax=Arundo donax TaxID=35708 RepID=A0A0A9A6I5_ARUDO